MPAALRRWPGDCGSMGVTMGSHDDPTAETRAFYRGIGAAISEFPTTVEAARAAHAAGEPVLMGAPNVVRGGSQAGNIAAAGAGGRRACVDALVSDYHYPALPLAAWALVDAGLARSAAGLGHDLGAPPARDHGAGRPRAAGPRALRADLVVVNPETRRVGRPGRRLASWRGGSAASVAAQALRAAADGGCLSRRISQGTPRPSAPGNRPARRAGGRGPSPTRPGPASRSMVRASKRARRGWAGSRRRS